MKKNKQIPNSIDDIRDLIKKLLILELFKLDMSQIEISRKLKIDNHAVNSFLKGIKKN